MANNAVLLGGQTFNDPTQAPAGQPSTQANYPTDGDVGLDSRYVVAIKSTALNQTIYAMMQEKIQLKVTSEWTPLAIFGSGGGNVFSDAFQAATGISLITKISTRRLWRGTSPVALTLSLMFYSINDARSDVLIPSQQLLKLVLPSDNKGINPFLSPPGPNVIQPGDLTEVKKTLGTTGGGAVAAAKAESTVDNIKGDVIGITIGNYLSFLSVIIREATVIYDTKLDPNGVPISAEAQVVFETYEIMTKQSLDQAFKATSS